MLGMTPSYDVSQRFVWPPEVWYLSWILPSSPYRMTSRSAFFIAFTGTLSLKPCFFATASTIRKYQVFVEAARDQGAIAPSAMEMLRFGMMSPGSICIFTPRPVQSVQAPCGELKLKLRGASSPIDVPSNGHE